MTHPFTLPLGTTVEFRTHDLGGEGCVFKFPNGWGASVIRNTFSYGNEEGLYELAVLDKNGAISYFHPVAQGDVRGWLTVDDVSNLLREISEGV